MNSVHRLSKSPIVALAVLLLLGLSMPLHAANKLEFSLKNQHSNDACTEYFAELWVTVAKDEKWQIAESNIAVSYNTSALSAQNIAPAFEANQSLVDEGVSINQIPEVNAVRISLLKSSGFAEMSGEFKIATFKWSIEDPELNDDLVFITSSPSTKIFNNSTQLNHDCGDAGCFGTTSPKARLVSQVSISSQPASLTSCEGEKASISVIAHGCDVGYEWQILEDDEWEATGDEGSSLSFAEVSPKNAGTYRVVISGDNSDDVISAEAKLTVNTAPVIEASPEDEVACLNDEVILEVEASGTPRPDIQWQRDTGEGFEDLKDENDSELVLSEVPESWSGYQYRAIVSNDCGKLESSSATLTVYVEPSINIQPNNQLVCEGDEAVYEPEISGTPAPDVQWQFDAGDGEGWEDLEDETDVVLSLEGVSIEMSGNRYRAVISNHCGEVTTSTSTLTVFTAPAIDESAEDVVVCEGEAASFSASASGNPVPTVQWESRGEDDEEWTPIEGATLKEYSFTPTSKDDGRLFRAVFTNRCGTETTEAELIFFTPPSIDKQPGSISRACEGNEFELFIDASGTDLEYQWLKDGEEVEDANDASLFFEEISQEDEGVYELVISNDCESVTSEEVEIVVDEPLFIDEEPEDQTVCRGETAEFFVEAGGAGLRIQWQAFDEEEEDWFDLEGQTDAALTFNPAQPADEGSYRARVSGSCETDLFSEEVTLVVNIPPAINDQPVGGVVCESESFVLSVGASGTGITYQWYLNGTAIDGADRSTYRLNPVKRSDAGQYSVNVSGPCDPSVWSNNVNVDVTPLPDITQQPQTMAICLGGNHTFNVTATGPGTLTYQWEFSRFGSDWEQLNSATNPNLPINGSTQDDEGFYRVVVKGSCPKAVTSDEVQLIIQDPVEILLQPEEQTACVGNQVVFLVGAVGTALSGSDNDELKYQWHRNGVSIPGGFKKQLILPNVSTADQGAYQVRIEGKCSTIWSDAVQLNIQPKPEASIVAPKNVRVTVGEEAAFEVNSNCLPGAGFQWYKGSTALVDDDRISGAQTSRLVISSVVDADRGSNYFCIVSCECGTAESDRAAIEIDVAEIVFVDHPEDVSVCDGEDVCFTVVWNSFGQEVNIQWLDADDNPVAGADQATYCPTNYADGDAYKARLTLVSDGNVTTVSNLGRIEVLQAPQISAQPQAQEVCSGSVVEFRVTVSNPGVNGTSYQWFFDGAEIADATAEILNLGASNDGQLGDYYVEISNDCGTVQSETVSLTFLEETQITTQPVHPKNGDPLDFGESMSLSVAASGSGDCNYTWQFSDDGGNNWVDLGNGNEATYQNHLNNGEEGQYRVVANCGCNDVTSDVIDIVVDETVGVDDDVVVNQYMSLKQNHPNPFAGVTTISFELRKSMNVELIVTDMLGQVVAKPMSESLQAGQHEVALDGSRLNLPAGSYNYTLKADGYTVTRQMIYMK